MNEEDAIQVVAKLYDAYIAITEQKEVTSHQLAIWGASNRWISDEVYRAIMKLPEIPLP